ncbi:MAG: hypothetical protein JO016_20325 [Actinobacteria bacterium]|nr:hypothetical protein [Actinomycetota bacterium]
MWSHFLAGANNPYAILGAGLSVAAALMSLLRTWITQAFRTRRFSKAIMGARPEQRSEIITACGDFEASSRRGPGDARLIICGASPVSRQATMTDKADRSVSLSENRLIHSLEKLVTELDLERHDFVIFGSGPLLAHGLRDNIRDLDVVARGAAWRCVSRLGVPALGSINGAPMALFYDGSIQFSRGWVSDDWTADDLIERAEIIEGLPFARLADVLAYKQMLRRPKDLPDIEALLGVLGKPD